jgi:hypothetical protein
MCETISNATLVSQQLHGMEPFGALAKGSERCRACQLGNNTIRQHIITERSLKSQEMSHPAGLRMKLSILFTSKASDSRISAGM